MDKARHKKPRRTAKNRQPASPERIDVDRRRKEMLDLRVQGYSLRAIGEKLGMHHSTVAEAIAAELDALTREPAEQLRTVELERMDAMLVALWPKVAGGDANTIDTALRVMQRRAKLLGLDAPSKQEHTGKDGAELFGKDTRTMSLAEMQAEMLKHAQEAMATTGNRLPDRDPEDGNAK